MLVAGMAAGDFYIICPDNDVTRDIDNRRILWGAEDTSAIARRCRAGTPTMATNSPPSWQRSRRFGAKRPASTEVQRDKKQAVQTGVDTDIYN